MQRENACSTAHTSTLKASRIPRGMTLAQLPAQYVVHSIEPHPCDSHIKLRSIDLPVKIRKQGTVIYDYKWQSLV